MGSGSNQRYPKAAMSFVSGSGADAARSAMQTSERGEMLLCLSPAPVSQTCSAKQIYCNLVLLKGVDG